MDRRKAIRLIGAVGGASGLLGSVETVLGKKGIRAFEGYSSELIEKHGAPRKGGVAVQGKKGEVKTAGFSHERTAGESVLKSKPDVAIQKELALLHADDQIISVEKFDLADGSTVSQVVRLNGENKYSVSVNDHRFVITERQLRRTLKRRLGKIEREKKSRKPKQDTTPDAILIDDINSDYTSPGFSDARTSETDTPVTGWINTGNDKTPSGGLYETAEVAGQAGIAGYAKGTAEAYTPYFDGGNWDFLNVEFKGEYKATGVNALGSSELTLEFFVENENGKEIGNAVVLNETQFVGDFWVKEESFSKGLYIGSTPDSMVTIGMRAFLKCAAVGASYTTISASSQPGSGEYDGNFRLDEFVIPSHVW